MHKKLSQRPWQAITAVMAGALFLAGNPSTFLPASAASTSVHRIAGDTRLATAARVAEEAFPGGTGWAVLTGADDWQATLGAGALAGTLRAAQLLSWPDRLEETEGALDRLGVKRIIIVGTIHSVSGSVERSLREKYVVERIAPHTLSGDNHYELARLLTARTILAAGGGVIETPGEIPGASPSELASERPSIKPQPSTSPRTSPSPTPSAPSGKPRAKLADTIGGELATERPDVGKNRPTLPIWKVPTGMGIIDKKRTVFIASGHAFPDALAASALSYKAGVPVLFASGPGEEFPAHTLLAIKAYNPQRIVVLGGQQAIDDGAVQAFRAQTTNAEVVRLAGVDRVATSVEIAKWSISKAAFDPDMVSVARGDAFPDAMTAGQYAANQGSPIILSTAPKYLTDVPVDFVLNHCRSVNKIVGFGGNAALDKDVLNALATAGGCTRPRQLPQVVPAPSIPAPKPTTRPTDEPSARPTETPSDQPSTQPTALPTPPSADASDAMKRVAITPWKIHPEVNRQIRTDVSGMEDKISTLSVLALTGTRDNAKLPRQVNWGLLACNQVRLDNVGVPIFSDANNDGYADGLGHASNEGIEITGINGRNVPNGKLLINQAVTTGRTNAILTSGIDDCAWVTAFDPADNNKIRVDKEGRAITPLGLGWLRIGKGPKPGDQAPRETNPKHVYNITPATTTKRIGEPVELTLTRRDGKAPSGRLTIVGMPCTSVTVGQGDVLVKPSPTDPRAGLGYGSTDHNHANVTHFNGKLDPRPRRLFGASPVNGEFRFTVNAPKADCGAFMVIEGNGNGKLDLDAARRPIEPFGVATVRWTQQ